MKKEYVLDDDCPNLNKMGWPDERKMNINDMYKALQSRYRKYGGEVVGVFPGEIVTESVNDLVYSIPKATFSSDYEDLYLDNDWSHNIDKLIEIYALSNSNAQLCVWHNHSAGTGCSTADMILLVDYFPVICEAYIDVNFIHRITPSERLKDLLRDEKYRSEFLSTLNTMHNNVFSTPQFNESLDALDEEYEFALSACYESKMNTLGKNTNNENDEARKEYEAKYKQLKTSARETLAAESGIDGYFDVKKISKKEIE